MNNTVQVSAELASAVASGLPGDLAVDVAVIPQFIAIPKVVEVCANNPVSVGAQDVY